MFNFFNNLFKKKSVKKNTNLKNNELKKKQELENLNVKVVNNRKVDDRIKKIISTLKIQKEDLFINLINSEYEKEQKFQKTLKIIDKNLKN